MASNFSFVIEKFLAGMERPGSHAPLQEDLEFLKVQGISGIVSLTESPLEHTLIEAFGFRYLHLPVADFTPPTLEQVRRFIAFLEEFEAANRAVVVHCAAGQGRTGTLLACALVHKGHTAAEAIEQLRTVRPHSIETAEQERMVQDFEWITRRKH